MKIRHVLPPALIAGLFALTALAADHTAPTATDPAPAKSETCVVSGDKLGEMGKPFEYIYKAAGKPDRVVQLCCKDCVKDFEKEPAKYLAKLDAAKAKKP